MSKKLYLVSCRGMTTIHGWAYVIAENTDEAYRKMRDDLDKRNLGCAPDRELATIELLAECVSYPDCKRRLYL